ncbi:hypothetical protein FOZ62_025837 [Perkinsus olseni]|uniref:Uncharacterized protein n=1 Tax=Perkinsus olseni TaxID=32597 RepID=A0A7J6SK19_PEROL|nr:hypothetical protein FOZ62_025837 [Perkinsus olseni]
MRYFVVGNPSEEKLLRETAKKGPVPAWKREIRTITDFNDILGKHSRDGPDMPALYVYHPPPLEQIIRESKPQDLAADLGSMAVILWAPRGGACPKCRSTLHSSCKDIASCKVILGHSWPERLYTTKRQCRACRHTWVCTSHRYLKTLPYHIAQELTSRYLVIEKSQYGMVMEPILRLRRGVLIQAELSVINGAEELELARRRQLYDITVAKYRSHSLYRKECQGMPAGEIAIPRPEASLSFYTLKHCFLKDYQRHEEALLRELQSYQCDGIVSVDHSRPICKRVTECKAGGYLCALIDGRGIILNLVLVNSTSIRELELAFSQLKGRICPLPEGSTAPRVTLYVDCGCCNTQGDNYRGMVSRSLEIEIDHIETKLDPLHGLFRLQRATNLSCPRATSFSRALSRGMFMPALEDIAALKCRRLRENKEGDPSRDELRLNVRRVIPSSEILNERLEKVVKTYLVLDEEARKTSAGDSQSNILLGPYFWSSYTSLQKHVLNNCLSDNPATTLYLRDSNNRLKSRRGTNSNECIHSTWKRSFSSISRCGAALFDAKSLWKVTYHNRKVIQGLTGRLVVPIPYSIDEVAATELAVLDEALVDEGPPHIKFGTNYLRAIDNNALDRLVAEWVGEEREDPDIDDDNPVIMETQDYNDFDSFTAADLGEVTEARDGNRDSPDDLLAKVLNSPVRRRKFLRLRGLRASTPTVPLACWSDLVKSTIQHLMCSLPADKVTPEIIWREYNKKLLQEIDRAVASDTEVLPLHRISQDNLREYMRTLNNRQSTMATTSTGMEAVIRLMNDLNNQHTEAPPAEPPSMARKGTHLEDGPAPVQVNDVVLEQLLRQMQPTPSVHPQETKLSADAVDPEVAEAVPEPPVRRRSNMLCKFCGLPLAATEFNGHIPDGTRFGLCPKAPPADPNLAALKEEASRRAQDYEVVSIEGKGKKCSLCSLPLGATLKDPSGNIVDKHERFAAGDNDKDLVWYCPVAQNLDEPTLASLRLVKQQRMEARQARKNDQKRKRYQEQVASKAVTRKNVPL